MPHNSDNKKTGYLNHHLSKTMVMLLLSYSTSIVLFIVLMAIGLRQINLTYNQFEHVTNDNNVKALLLDKMEKAARERSLAMYTMVFLDDPFERDEVFLKFKGYAIDFIIARQQLLQMNLSKEEKELLDRQGQHTSLAAPLQEQIVSLVQADKTNKAIELLIYQAIPAQNRVLNTLSKLHDLQMESNSNIARHIKEQHDRETTLIIGLASITLLITLAIAVFVMRRIASNEHNLFIEKELAQVTLNSIGDGVITTDKRGIITSINPVGEELTGYDSDEAIGQDITQIFTIKNEKNNNYIDNPIDIAIQKNVIYTSPSNIVLERKNGDIFAIEHTVSPIKDVDGHILGANIVFRDVTEMRKLADTLAYQATHDSLTGLINRREFERLLKQAIYKAHDQSSQYVLCFLDLDQFKLINDTAGHAAGDEFLKQISHQLSANLRRTDVLSRLGGDEFAILLDDCHLDKAETIANKICSTIMSFRFIWENNSFSTGASIGVVPINEYTSTVSEVMSAADTACYEAKEKGRNRVQTYWLDDEKLELKRKEMAWVQKLEDAMSNDNLVLYAQEFMPLADDASITNNYMFEILVRLREEDGSITPPMAFLPAAERYHLMPYIDKWVIENTFKYMEQLGKRISYSLHFSINLSGQTITEKGLDQFIIDTAKQYNIDHQSICFEITETAAIANMSKAIKLIHTLKNVGFKFSLDDFGSGLSSFAYLKNMPVDNLKIDGVFIRDITTDSTDLAFVEAIHSIAKMMNISTTAEFVEDEATLNKLKEIGISYMQGYQISRPVALDKLFPEHQITLEKRVSL